MESKKERNNIIDVMKGIMILFVVIYHLIYRNKGSLFDDIVREMIYLSMPLFFCLAGYFYRDNGSRWSPPLPASSPLRPQDQRRSPHIFLRSRWADRRYCSGCFCSRFYRWTRCSFLSFERANDTAARAAAGSSYYLRSGSLFQARWQDSCKYSPPHWYQRILCMSYFLQRNRSCPFDKFRPYYTDISLNCQQKIKIVSP